jgi:signal peptidase II
MAIEATAEDDARSGTRTHWLVLLSVAGAVLVIDQAAKATVRARLAYGDSTSFAGVDLHHTRNPGLLGGTLPGAAVPVGLLTLVGLAIALRAYATHPSLSTTRRVACGLLLGGSVGNLIDRLRLSYVTDFIARNDRNAFNLADLAIYAGLGLLLLLLFVGDRRNARRPARL